mgnify:CR=1 FL=1
MMRLTAAVIGYLYYHSRKWLAVNSAARSSGIQEFRNSSTRSLTGMETGLRHFIFDRFLKNALFTAFRQYFFVKFPAFYCCMVLYIYLACVIIFL